MGKMDTVVTFQIGSDNLEYTTARKKTAGGIPDGAVAYSAIVGIPEDSDVDVLEVVAIDPLILLVSWVDILQHYLWVHYIDNNCIC